MFVTQQRTKRREGGYYTYWVIRESYWDKKQKRQRQRHLATIGKTQKLSLDEARDLAEELTEKTGREVTVDELRGMKRIRVVEDQTEKSDV